jgi:hypothetical protein
VSVAFWLVVLVLAATPALVILDGLFAQALVGLVIAAALSAVVVDMRPGEGAFLSKTLRPFLAAVSIPSLWMAAQLLPVPRPLAHPIWESAAAGSGEALLGSITIDTGATLIACGHYLTVVAMMIAVASLAVDRVRAERLLFVLAAASVGAALAPATGMFVPDWFGRMNGSAAALNAAALGVVICAAAATCAVERHETRRSISDAAVTSYRILLSCCLAGLAIHVAVLARARAAGILLAAGAGVAALVGVVLIRRLGFGRWGIAAVACTYAMGLAGLILAAVPNGAGDATLLLSADATSATASLTRRMLAERLWFGTGAGTFPALVPIYRDLDELARAGPAPTAAAALVVELGAAFFWSALGLALAAVVSFLRGALERGRDSFYAMAGAGTLLAGSLLLFANAGLLSSAPALLLVSTMGLAIPQRTRRSSQES